MLRVGKRQGNKMITKYLLSHCKVSSSILLGSALVTALLLMTPNAKAQPQCGYEVVIIHPNPCGQLGPPAASARGLNSFGHLAGHRSRCSDGYSNAISWTSHSGIVDLLMPEDTLRSQSLDVSDNGLYVGWVDINGDDLGSLGFLRDGETAIMLGTLPGGNYSEATAINYAGQVTGVWGNNVIGNPEVEAFIWEKGIMSGLGGSLSTPNSFAADINDKGQITGWMGLSHIMDSHAFIWDKGMVTELPFIPGGFTSAGFSLNDNGDVAGWGKKIDEHLQDDVRRAFLWTNGKMIDLGVLPGRTESFAHSVNDAKQVVGSSWDFGSNGAPFIWQNGVMTNLNDLVPPEFTIASAWAINNEGMIAGSGNGADGGFPGMALLIPIPQPVGDLDSSCSVNENDLIILLNDWGQRGGSPSDLDGNGIVNTSDLLILFSNWG